MKKFDIVFSEAFSTLKEAAPNPSVNSGGGNAMLPSPEESWKALQQLKPEDRDQIFSNMSQLLSTNTGAQDLGSLTPDQQKIWKNLHSVMHGQPITPSTTQTTTAPSLTQIQSTTSGSASGSTPVNTSKGAVV